MLARLIAIVLALMAVPSFAAELPPYKLTTVFTFGHTWGGATLIQLHYTDGRTQDLKAGGGNFFSIGGSARLTRWPVDLSLSVGEHVDKDNGFNAEFRFSRIPIEAMAYARVRADLRVGAGLRYLARTRMTMDFEGTDYGTLKFTSPLSPVLEADWWLNENVGFGLRRVSEKVRVTDGASSFDGDASHWGFFIRLQY